MKKVFLVRRVIGNSMLPTLKPGKIVVASGFKKFKPGSIVFAKVDGREVVKRVVKMTDDAIWLKSDNRAEGKDYGPISPSQIIATKL